MTISMFVYFWHNFQTGKNWENLNNSDLSYFCKMSISMFVYFLQNFQTPIFFCEMTNSMVEKDGEIQINFLN